MSVVELVVVVVAALVGAAAQGCTGIGFGLLAGPFLVAIDADFVPGPMLLSTLLINGSHVVGDRAHLDRGVLGRLGIGAPIGLVVGLGVLSAVSDRALALLVGVVVVGAAVIVLAGFGPRRTGPTLFAAGAATAFTGVTTGLPGPPMSIVFHDADPPMMRSTSSLFVAAFTTVAAVSLLAVGEFGGREGELTLLLAPSVVVGLAAARFLRPVIDATVFRPAILVLAGGGGIALILRHL